MSSEFDDAPELHQQRQELLQLASPKPPSSPNLSKINKRRIGDTNKANSTISSPSRVPKVNPNLHIDVQSGFSLPYTQDLPLTSQSVISAATFYPTELNPPALPSPSTSHPTVQYLSQHRPSFVRSTRTLFMGDNKGNMSSGVDENIYHWKVLNLSRAKLKASSRTSALLSGFAMVAMVEIQIDKEVPQGLLIAFAVITVLLIAVHMLALMISTCILPNVEAVANLHYQTQKTVFESPHMKMNFIVELAWAFSTVLGILLFLLEIVILCWVKFYSLNQTVAWVATGLLIPVICIFMAFAYNFYRKLVSHKSEVQEEGIKELELLKGQLEDPEVNNQGDNHSSSPTSSKRAVQIV